MPKHKSNMKRTFVLPTGHEIGTRAARLPDGIANHPDNVPFLSGLIRSGKVEVIEDKPAAKRGRPAKAKAEPKTDAESAVTPPDSAADGE